VTDLADRKPVRVEVAGSAVLLVRNGDELFAIDNRCPHQGAPLHKGPVRFGGSLRTVRCPLHGSTFDLADGRVLRGPATEPGRTYGTRVREGIVEIRPR
jgi:nitrite reductase/ring-hydroxylating ferredoxin subunit